MWISNRLSLILALCLIVRYFAIHGSETLCKCYDSNISSTDQICDCNLQNTTHTQLKDLVQSYPELCARSDKSLKQLRLVNITQNSFFANFPVQCDWSNLVNFTVSFTNLTRLNSSHLAKLSKLERLNLSHNKQLGSYGEDSFEPVSASLVELVAIGNPIRSLTRNVFRGLRRLERLVLSDNKIGYIETGLFSQNCCASLRELRLDHNILTVLESDSLAGLIYLEILDLRYNPLQQLDANVFLPCASSLIELRMSHDDQTTFGGFSSPTPRLFSQLRYLQILEMVQLKLTNLSSSTFEGLENLKQLILRENRLMHLPADVFASLTQLQYLDLSGNWLVCISSAQDPSTSPDFVAGLPLRWIDLSWNRLTHLNQLTARSLGLFDPVVGGTERLILNLTANPWQQIDDNTFCNPAQPDITRPVDLIVGPLTVIPFSNWLNSLGLWTSRAMWPKGPLGLIGSLSLVRGLMLNEDFVSSNNSTFHDPFQLSKPHRGLPDAAKICQYLTRQGEDNSTNHEDYQTTAEFLDSIGVKKSSDSKVVASLASKCPRLSTRKLEDWELSALKISSLITTVEGITRTFLSTFEQGSRLYLLIIVGVCITFLFVALTVIMCYRAWSRRTSQKFVQNDFDIHPNTVLTHESSVEKHLLLQNPVNRPELCNGKPAHRLTKSNQPPGYCLANKDNVSNDNTDITKNGNVGEDPNPVQRSPQSAQEIQLPLLGPSQTIRSKSDSEASAMEDRKLTSLGIV